MCAEEHTQILKEINGKCKEIEQKTVQMKRQQIKISNLKQDIVGMLQLALDVFFIFMITFYVWISLFDNLHFLFHI